MRKKREWLSFDLTPLIDIVFLLLIFFMVFSVFKKDDSILNISLPKADAAHTVKEQKRYLIELSQEALALNGHKTTLDSFVQKSPLIPKGTPVVVSIDKNVVYERITTLLNVLKKNQIENISLLVKK